jgi:hypothetical protein
LLRSERSIALHETKHRDIRLARLTVEDSPEKTICRYLIGRAKTKMSVLALEPPAQDHALPGRIAPLVLSTGQASAIRVGICGGDFRAVFDLVAMQASPRGFAAIPRQ